MRTSAPESSIIAFSRLRVPCTKLSISFSPSNQAHVVTVPSGQRERVKGGYLVRLAAKRRGQPIHHEGSGSLRKTHLPQWCGGDVKRASTIDRSSSFQRQDRLPIRGEDQKPRGFWSLDDALDPYELHDIALCQKW